MLHRGLERGVRGAADVAQARLELTQLSVDGGIERRGLCRPHAGQSRCGLRLLRRRRCGWAWRSPRRYWRSFWPRRPGRTWRTGRRSRRLRRESADRPAEAAVRVHTGYSLGSPAAVPGLPVHERRAETDAATEVEVGVGLLRFGALDVVLSEAEVQGIPARAARPIHFRRTATG